jgi:HEPN domain-containing protein
VLNQVNYEESPVKVDKELVVSTWAVQGLRDFYISFEFEDLNKWHTYSTFFCHQGLEKVSKAYLIATRSAEYENLSEEETLKKVDQIAKEYHHSLQKLLEKLTSRNALTGAEVSCKVEGYTGQQLIDVLEKAYIESRYPVPSPIHKKFPVRGRSRYQMYHDPSGSTAPIKYSRKLALAILKKIEKDFVIVTPRQKLATHVSDRKWKRFCSLFYGLESEQK